MHARPLTIRSWPRAILHLDADAFFASCEQAVHPDLRGRPVVTGRERGIVAAASYEAKARGVKRGMGLFDVKKLCPEAVVLPSDYETYSLFSVRMFDILRRFSPDVEEYSIDEAFVDLTGLRRSFNGPYGMIAGKMREAVEAELGITVSAGLSLTKVLAKVGSKWNKPRGLTLMPGRKIHVYLRGLPVEEVWGIGRNTSALLGKLGVRTALEFAVKGEGFIRRHLSKPYLEIWHELNGRSVYPVIVGPRSAYQSISKARTFTPPSGDEKFLLAQLSGNLENACIKARRHGLAAARLAVFLRGRDFKDIGMEMRLSRPTAYPAELFGPLREGFRTLCRSRGLYRQSRVVLAGLVPEAEVRHTLFDDAAKVERMRRVYRAVDGLSGRFGKHALRHASSLPAGDRHEGERGDVPRRRMELLRGESGRRRLGLPVLDVRV
jgi:DNA polymerase-4/DNA polymerase V